MGNTEMTCCCGSRQDDENKDFKDELIRLDQNRRLSQQPHVSINVGRLSTVGEAVRISSQPSNGKDSSDSDICSVELENADAENDQSTPEEESVMQVENILEGLNWFTKLQIEVLLAQDKGEMRGSVSNSSSRASKGSRSDLTEVVRNLFVEKLQQEVEVKQNKGPQRRFTLSAITQSEEGKGDEESKENCFSLQECATMDLKALGQILQTFMPIVRLDEKNNYFLLGTKVQQL